MTWFDYGVLAIVGISVLLSALHGLVRELLALASWVIAFLAARSYAADAAQLMPDIANPALQMLLGFCAVFLCVLLAMTMLAVAASAIVKSAGLGMVDRLLGAVFGLVRGTAIVMIVVLLSGLTPFPKHPEWQHALLSQPLEILANMVKVWLPYDLSRHIKYD